MAIERSFGSNGQFSLTDWTEEVVAIPRPWNLIDSLGIFTSDGITQTTVTFDKTTKETGLVGDRVRGDRASVSKEDTRQVISYPVPWFPLDDALTPSDVQGKRLYGGASDAETEAAVRMRKMEALRRKQALTLEKARAYCLTDGKAYNPNGTLGTVDYYSVNGVNRTSVDFALGTSGTDLIGKTETVIAAIQDNSGDVAFTGVVVLCSPTWFAKFISHNNIKTAYQYYTSTQEPLRNRLAADGSPTALYRSFQFGGATFLEYRGQAGGANLITAGKAYAVPTGTPYFKTVFAPADKFFATNSMGEELYMFEYPSMKGDKVEIESESNHLSYMTKPELCIELTTSN